MAIHDISAQRLFVSEPLQSGGLLQCNKEHVHYLLHVLRVSDGNRLLVFNGVDGEWQAEVASIGKRACSLRIHELTRPQDRGPDTQLLFAPLKRTRLDYMVQKATELGAAELRPVLTQHTVPDRINAERMRANAIEASEQCGILYVPEVADLTRLDKVLDDWDTQRTLIFCDEAAGVASPIQSLAGLERGSPVAVLIGPEGGFSDAERHRLQSLQFVHPISLGPRVMRADTAATAALALVNAVVGDWC